MAHAYFTGNTIDDVMHHAIKAILKKGEKIRPTKGGPKGALELIGALLEVTNPRARLSRTETRGKSYSCLGELCWYLAGSNELSFIEYYISLYRKSADRGRVFGGYGPRLLNWRGINQLENVINLLKKKRDSRQAVIQLFDRHDILRKHKDIPCTCTLQFLRRHDKLHMVTNMRSNDAYKGLAHDIFCFTMLQEIVARSLSIDVGTYKHAVGSLHLYIADRIRAQQFLNEGWQPTINVAMPRMPIGDPWRSIKLLLDVESRIRTTGTFDDGILDAVDPYWADLMRLLQIFRYKTHPNRKKIEELRQGIASSVYLSFIDKVLIDLTRKKH